MTNKRNRIEAALEEFLRQSEFLGATLISRDGVCLVNTEKRILSPEAFGAMTATLMSAAETAFFHLGGGRNLRVIAETDSNRMIALGANDDLLLAVLTRTGVEPSRLVPRIEDLAKQIRTIMAEA